MKVVIHGTQFGYDVMYPNREQEEVVGFKDSDIGDDSNKIATIGQQAYFIYFKDGYVTFSTCKIIRDVEGGSRTGSIIFSLVIPNNKRLSGKNVLALLNQLSNEFCQKHIINNNLDKFREDWAFVNAIIAPYQDKLLPNDEELQSRTDDPAFVYYTNEAQLQKYFDAPYEEEYTAYKQVFFIEEALKGKSENPLNALRHNPEANLTEKIDLDNPKYKLFFKEYTAARVKIEVKVKDSPRFNGDKIRKKDELEIIYSKPFHHSEEIKGTLDKINKYVDEKEGTVRIKDDVVLKPIIHDFTFEVREDGKSNPINDAQIILKSEYQSDRKAENNKITLTDEDLQHKWTAVAMTKDGSLISAPKEIRVEDENVPVKLILRKHKKIKIIVFDQEDGGIIRDFTARITKQGVDKKPDEENRVKFDGDEIEKTWSIQVESNGYKSKNEAFRPADEMDEKVIRLTKLPKYCIEPIEKVEIDGIEKEIEGTKKSGCPSYSNYNDGRDVKDYIQPPKGYRLVRFDFDEENKGNKDGTINARYEKLSFLERNKKWLSIGGIVGTIAIVASILFLGSDNYEESQHQQQPQQQQYNNEREQPDEQSSTNEENQYKQQYQEQQYDDKCEQVEEQSSESITI